MICRVDTCVAPMVSLFQLCRLSISRSCPEHRKGRHERGRDADKVFPVLHKSFRIQPVRAGSAPTALTAVLITERGFIPYPLENGNVRIPQGFGVNRGDTCVAPKVPPFQLCRLSISRSCPEQRRGRHERGRDADKVFPLLHKFFRDLPVRAN